MNSRIDKMRMISRAYQAEMASEQRYDELRRLKNRIKFLEKKVEALKAEIMQES